MDVRLLPAGVSPYSGRTFGHWCATWTPNYDAAPVPIDYGRELSVMRPHERLTACIIARDAEDDIGGCIESLSCVDRVHVYDTGSTDATRERAAELRAEVVSGY